MRTIKSQIERVKLVLNCINALRLKYRLARKLGARSKQDELMADLISLYPSFAAEVQELIKQQESA